MYLKATHIETIQEKLNDCLISYTSAKNKLANLYKAIDEIAVSKKECEAKLKMLQSVERFKIEIKTLKSEIHWINVIEQEGVLDEVNQTLRENELALKNLSEKINNRSYGENEVQAKIR